ncbi:MAG: alkaline phosphatase family protein, partial [Bacillota bacterium]
MNNIVYPDYDNSILNTIAAVMKHYGVDTKYNENQKLMELLDKNYKNVVLMIFDGMGVDILESLLQKDDILRANITAEVTSVYPSTTTAAMTAYYSGLSPFEHGWLGWSLYFKEYGRCLDTFINRDSFSGEYLDMPNAAYYLMPYETVFDKIEKAAKGKTSCHIIQPKGIKWYGKSAWHGVSSTKEMCNL